jgi:GxxExxY protein
LTIVAAKFASVSREINAISGDIIDCAVKVHKALGPGLLESSYRICLAHELSRRGHNVQQELSLPIKFEGITLASGYKIDLLVDEAILVELKAVESLLPIHKAQLLSYLRHSGKRLGLLLNFDVVLMKDDIDRIVCD